MEGSHHPGDPAQLRISDTDRHRVAEVLREAAAEGRLELEELEERLEATWGAKVYADLVPIVVDLPGGLQSAGGASPPVVRGAGHDRLAPHVSAAGGPVPATRHDTSLAVMSNQDRRGVWEVGATHTAFSMMGAVRLDLREAVLAAPVLTINASTVMGSIDIVVNAWTRVSVDGFGVMGDFSQGRDKVPAEIGPSSPLVRVKGIALMGAVTVVRKPMPGEPRRRRRQLGH
jgi:hypothetical protein